MLVTSKLVYLQLQKTGGTHIESLLQKYSGGVQSYGKHFRMPANFDTQGKLIVGSIRNPWSWYLSYWTYSCMRKGGPYLRSVSEPSIYSTIFDNRLKNTRGALRRTPRQLLTAIMSNNARSTQAWKDTYDSDDPKKFRDWVCMALNSNRKYELFQDYGHSSVNGICGLLTYLYLFLYLSNGRLLFNGKVTSLETLREVDTKMNILDSIIRTEKLESDVVALFERAGLGLNPDQHKLINNTKRENQSVKRYTFDEYFDAETSELIAAKEKFICDKYSYSFQGA